MQLKLGCNGNDVAKLQMIMGLNADGDFGPVTEARVKIWQIQNNIPATGIIEDLAWSRLFPPFTLNISGMSGKIPAVVLSQIPETATIFGISSALRLAHFLAQCGHESGGFKLVNENLNYNANRLKEIFGKYFPDDLHFQYANNPVKIASRVYADRMGNGNESSQDGYKFRGRGYIQLTGKDNYTSFARFIGEDTVANPDLVATKYPLASAAFYFGKNKIWSICDKGGNESVITEVIKAVNGGTIGLPDRIRHFNEYYDVLK